MNFYSYFFHGDFWWGLKHIFYSPRAHYWFYRKGVYNPKSINKLSSQYLKPAIRKNRILPKGRRWRGDVGVIL